MLFDSVIQPDTPPSLVGFDSFGDIVGGAWVADTGCRCDCGRVADLDLGSVSIDYDDGIVTFNQTFAYSNFFTWIDGGQPSLASGFYVARLEFEGSDEACRPRIIAYFDFPTSFTEDGLHTLTVDYSGQGMISQATPSGSSSWDEITGVFERAGVVYGSAVGTYASAAGDIVIGTQVAKSWRLTTSLPPVISHPPF